MGKANVISLSGGKDSTAMLLWALEKGEQFDEVIFFDGGWEFPQMHAHIEKLKELVPITTLRPDKPFDWYAFERPLKKARNRGLIGYGWPKARGRWCTGLKRNTISRYLKQKYPGGACRWIGLAADELHRVNQKGLDAGEFRYPLIEWGKTEADCLEYCREKGFDWGGLYDEMKRVSCWCCPLQGIAELKVLRRDYPELWAKLKEMDARSSRPFRTDYTIYGLEHKIDGMED